MFLWPIHKRTVEKLAARGGSHWDQNALQFITVMLLIKRFIDLRYNSSYEARSVTSSSLSL